MAVFKKRSVHQGEHVGDTIRSLREENGFTIEELAERARVDKKYIVAFEQYRYHDLPGSLYAKNFLRSIAGAFNINAEKLLERFSDEEDAFPFKRNITPPKAISNPTFWTPKRLRTFAVIIVLCIGIFYVFVELGGLFQSPDLIISSPQDNIELQATSVEVEGKTEKGATVTINNASIDVDDDGSFSTQIDITPGVNTLTITSTQKFGRSTTVVRNLFATIPALN